MDGGEKIKTFQTMQQFINKASELFRICDETEKGFITRRDLWKHRDSFSLTPEQLEEVFDYLDKDKSGYINEEEFIDGYASHLGINIEDMKEQEILETERKHEEKEEEGLEELLNAIDEGEKEKIDQIWDKVREKNPEINSSKLKEIIANFGKY